jgi:3-dehydroquinate dehydratase-2
VTGVMMGMREYSYLAALLALTFALDDDTFLGLPRNDTEP